MPKPHSPKGGHRPLAPLAALLIAVCPAVSAQSPPRQYQWYDAAIAVAGVSVFLLVDNPVRTYMLDNQTEGKDNAADLFRKVGQPEVWALVPAVMVGTGLVFKKPGLARSGLRAVTSAVMAGGVAAVFKEVIGRVRPNVEGSEPLDFKPFSGNVSMPSGHTSAAFGFSASLAEDVHPLWAKIGLYALATGTAWSRLYNNEHWTSDVVAGAVVGITSAKLVSGKWQVWGIRPPAVFTNGREVTVSWQGTF
jgi:membrane-associated phospholipid phosphatase